MTSTPCLPKKNATTLARPDLTHPTCLIVNTSAGRGHIRATLPAVRAAFRARGVTTILETSAAGQEETLAERALADGATTIVAVGGDGTCSMIANAILRSGARCRLAVVPAGTGNDFAKTLGVRGHSPEEVASLVARGSETLIDVAHADGRYFLNSCGFGFDASVLEASNRIRFLRGDAVYIYAALQQLFSYRGIDVSTNGAAGVERGTMLMVTVSNGQWLGGAFRIAPQASVIDGRLNTCFFRDAGVVQRVRLFAGALRGTHLGMRAVTSASVAQLTLTFSTAPMMEMDGELRSARSKRVDLKCVPRALAVIAADGAVR